MSVALLFSAHVGVRHPLTATITMTGLNTVKKFYFPETQVVGIGVGSCRSTQTVY
jgi:hypothetical protein